MRCLPSVNLPLDNNALCIPLHCNELRPGPIVQGNSSYARLKTVRERPGGAKEMECAANTEP